MVVLNVPEEVIQRSINESLFNTFGVALSPSSAAVLWSIVVSSQSIGALLGCFMVTPLLNRCGVKSALMLLNNVLLVLGSLTIDGFFLWFMFLVGSISARFRSSSHYWANNHWSVHRHSMCSSSTVRSTDRSQADQEFSELFHTYLCMLWSGYWGNIIFGFHAGRTANVGILAGRSGDTW
ncbi:hypothetical protein ANCCAN_29487 [Ancylostoma caninum]|uniref:Major facilitator superfamily (MFS) profile domain-containing protein n=1 Tax=Ancylostoma caninum TaxID=29170 RepID=A0A368F1D1_ANCCA|nr:hypothetical protein ANCCAN_29487 [Ancylostoma caninum]